MPLVFDVRAEIYNKHGINFNSLNHLESIGLVQFSSIAGIVRRNFPKKFAVRYDGKPLALEMPGETDNKLEIGKVLLTKIGQELAPICRSRAVEGFRDYVMDQWKQYLPKSESG